MRSWLENLDFVLFVHTDQNVNRIDIFELKARLFSKDKAYFQKFKHDPRLALLFYYFSSGQVYEQKDSISSVWKVRKTTKERIVNDFSYKFIKREQYLCNKKLCGNIRGYITEKNMNRGAKIRTLFTWETFL